jgi:hypothetical protein
MTIMVEVNLSCRRLHATGYFDQGDDNAVGGTAATSSTTNT